MVELLASFHTHCPVFVPCFYGEELNSVHNCRTHKCSSDLSLGDVALLCSCKFSVLKTSRSNSVWLRKAKVNVKNFSPVSSCMCTYMHL